MHTCWTVERESLNCRKPSHHPFLGSPRLPYNGVNNRRLRLLLINNQKGSDLRYVFGRHREV